MFFRIAYVLMFAIGIELICSALTELVANRGVPLAPPLGILEQRLLESCRQLEKEHQHGAAVGRSRSVMAAFGADDEIARGAFAFVIDQ